MIGKSISHYRITGKIGEGGMGEVYRATDTRLHREVALKLLPEHFSSDPQRMARFEREALVLASLNHPNIAGIHGLEESDRKALVMELVQGRDLAERLAQGALPLKEALPLALQIAEALEAAHEKNVIHRDLKPANIMITHEGQVKVLDFGLAKALADDPEYLPDLSMSPTRGLPATEAGMILGTAGYMSPEQARAQAVDRRADIWAFGVILFEMLSGTRAFEGQTVSDVLAKILEREPAWDELPKEIPEPIRALIRRCLEKNVRKRLQAIGEARLLLETWINQPETAQRPSSAVPASSRWKSILPWALAGAASLGLFILLVARQVGTEGIAGIGTPVRFDVRLSAGSLDSSLGSAVVFSKDGTRIAHVAGEGGRTGLYVRSLDQLESVSLTEGTGGLDFPYNAFFSPDGTWIGYVTISELRKIPVSAGTPLTLCRISRSRGASWAPDNSIIFAPTPASGLFRISAAGGEPQPLTQLDEARGELTHRWPQILPGGKAVLFTAHTQGSGSFDNASIEAVVLETGERKVLHRGGYYARYAPTGHLLYVNRGTLFAIPFDLDRLETTGVPAPVVQNVSSSAVEGGAQYSFSDNGSLVYLAATTGFPEYPVVSVDRKGNSRVLLEARGAFGSPRLSPDGKRLALTVFRDGNWDVWVYDLDRSVATRLTFDEAFETEQIWSPDGRYLIFSSNKEGTDNLYRKPADGSGEPEKLTEGGNGQYATSWSRDGRFVAFYDESDLWVLDLQGDGKPQPFLITPFSEQNPEFSPDGRWIAYQSDESGRDEIYVRPFPPGGGKWQVSDGGGGYPRWSQDGGELFYRTDEGIMVAPLEMQGDSFRAGKPIRLFDGPFRGGSGGLVIGNMILASYDITPDGERFVMFPEEQTNKIAGHVTVVMNWFEELRRLGSPRTP